LEHEREAAGNAGWGFGERVINKLAGDIVLADRDVDITTARGRGYLPGDLLDRHLDHERGVAVTRNREIGGGVEARGVTDCCRESKVKPSPGCRQH